MGAESGGFELFADLITAVCRKVYDAHPELRRLCAVDREDFEQELRARVVARTARYWNQAMLRLLAQDVLEGLKAKKRFSRRVVPLTEKLAGELCCGPEAGVLAEVAARDAVRRLCDPCTEKRMSAEAVRLGLAALGGAG